MDEFSEDDIKDLLGTPQIGGIRKKCTDARRCGLGIACEHAQVREGVSCELVSLWTTFKSAECDNFTPRKELCSEGDILRSKPKKGGRRHNQLTRSNVILPKPPDLMVSRHIKDGRNIKGDNDS